MAEVTQTDTVAPPAPDSLGVTARRGWSRLPLCAREAVLPYIVARIVVLSALGLAHFIVDRTHPATVGVAARVHAGLLGWDAGWYETIARQGYGPLGRQSLRFFPAVPVLTHGLAWLGLGDGPALVLLANVAAFAATAMLFVLVRRETGSPDVARRAIWVLSLVPAAFVLVMGYAEAVLLVFALGCFLALRPPATGADNRPHFAVAGLLAFAATLTRPVGVLLFLAVAVGGGPMVAAPRPQRACRRPRCRRGAVRRTPRLPRVVQAHGERLVGTPAGPTAERAPRRAR